MPFAIVDKQHARIHVFEAGGRLLASSAVLLGASTLQRFAVQRRIELAAQRGKALAQLLGLAIVLLQGEHVVWVDYASAFAIHRLRPGPALRQRQAQLVSATPDDNRASLGCVVVPVAFYASVVQPVLGQRRAVVYVLPESGQIGEAAFAL